MGSLTHNVSQHGPFPSFSSSSSPSFPSPRTILCFTPTFSQAIAVRQRRGLFSGFPCAQYLARHLGEAADRRSVASLTSSHLAVAQRQSHSRRAHYCLTLATLSGRKLEIAPRSHVKPELPPRLFHRSSHFQHRAPRKMASVSIDVAAFMNLGCLMELKRK